MKILVIDDHAASARALSEVLQRDGHRVLTAPGGREGLDVFRTADATGSRFDVVITDYSMADIDGIAVAAAVKATSASTPVVLLSGYKLDAASRLPPHVDAVLLKPPRIEAVRSTLARCNPDRDSGS